MTVSATMSPNALSFIYLIKYRYDFLYFFPGSLSVNVSVTSGKDEYVNAGQLSASSSQRDMLFKVLSTGILALLMHAFGCNGVPVL